MLDIRAYFEQVGGQEDHGFLSIHAPVQHTPNGTPYLTCPGVIALARPQTNLAGLAGFLNGYGEDSPFPEYLNDPTPLPDGAQLCKVAGQLCYMSFGRKRSYNADAGRYFDNLKSSGHGSVFEHANFSLLLYGVSRSVTHELIRHRAGMGYCLTGDTLIYSNKTVKGKPGGTKKRRLDDIYAMTQTPHGRSRLKLLRLRCLDEQTGTFTVGKVKSVVCSGMKPVFTVTLADGKTITTTKEHRFLTKEGWKFLEEIVGGLTISASGKAIYGVEKAEIMVNGQKVYKNAGWLHEHYVVKGLSRRGVENLRQTVYARDGYACRPCANRSRHLNIHHVLPVWARPDLVCDINNPITVCPPCHYKITGHEEEYIESFGHKCEELKSAVKPVAKSTKFIPKPVKIVSITYAGEQMTYDIEMEGPNHNFVANGIITHNSQQSQRYVSGRMVRFVERPEYAIDEGLHAQFLQRIERASAEYAAITERILEMQHAGAQLLSAEARTDLRKKVQQTARSVLPNETEAPIVVTGNARAWRHIISMRASAHAETEIRELAVRVFLCLYLTDPVLFSDYTLEKLPDGTLTVRTEFEKI